MSKHTLPGAIPCPICAADESRVTDSRSHSSQPNAIIRRRECLKCKARFSTREVLYDSDTERALQLTKDNLRAFITDVRRLENLL